MASKYDSFWRNHLESVSDLVHEAYETGNSKPFDVSALKDIGQRKSWYGTVCLTAGAITLGGDMVHAGSFADVVLGNGLLDQYGETEFRMTISRDLHLTVMRESAPEKPKTPIPDSRPKSYQIDSIRDLPGVPAVYALYGGEGFGRYVAYVGIGSDLRVRIDQHLVRRDSSISTGTSAAMLNPDYVTEINWWEHPFFEDRVKLEAAELVAFDVLEPSLRSRGAPRRASVSLLNDTDFVEAMKSLLVGEPTGHLSLPSLATALERIDELERRVTDLEKRIKQIGD